MSTESKPEAKLTTNNIPAVRAAVKAASENIIQISKEWYLELLDNAEAAHRLKAQLKERDTLFKRIMDLVPHASVLTTAVAYLGRLKERNAKLEEAARAALDLTIAGSRLQSALDALKEGQ